MLFGIRRRAWILYNKTRFRHSSHVTFLILESPKPTWLESELCAFQKPAVLSTEITDQKEGDIIKLY